jgi:hypothetical protein
MAQMQNKQDQYIDGLRSQDVNAQAKAVITLQRQLENSRLHPNGRLVQALIEAGTGSNANKAVASLGVHMISQEVVKTLLSIGGLATEEIIRQLNSEDTRGRKLERLFDIITDLVRDGRDKLTGDQKARITKAVKEKAPAFESKRYRAAVKEWLQNQAAAKDYKAKEDQVDTQDN